ncbi:2-iminoacetate synthase ThiH [Desulforhopalus singaporensis]|uniref:Tyrosine lyase ThiH n=1 Tax=Desulforhopalus singaporensis TaxID=91360 RepID=A0A1H0Q8I3_9BACT|nr:2-iminoacetate synthase ThiH [Desulforhopalus singaporensis]SDP13657.1 tyrosine lyase ThiH [Desulforhopalus singaporensis]
MSFFEVLTQYQDFSFDDYFATVTDADIARIVTLDKLRPADFLALLSPVAANHLELIAQRAHQLTVQYFGKTIQLFTPLYISNHCSNNCIYCGFNHTNEIKRRTLTLAEIEEEAAALSRTGMQHVLLLTGESLQATPIDYLVDTVRCLKKYFASVAIEIFPMEEEEYRLLYREGVDGLTLFQETYDQETYRKVHLAGRKKDFRFRLDGPERGARAGFRTVNIGALLGLAESRRDFFFTGLHAAYLEQQFLDTEVAVSLPRFNEAECDYNPPFSVNDKLFVQYLMAFRLFLPRAGITVSTRESSAMRDNLTRLGATRFSAGVCTTVGGYSKADSSDTPQFEITDERSVAEVATAIRQQGYQPVYKDWDDIR